jgi:alpha-ribazole phosphatase
MTDVTRWWWIRHAPVTGYDGRFYGGADVPADVSDARSFARLAAWLPKDAVWVTSHLSRAIDTADAIVAGGATPSERLVEPAIAEQRYGNWEGLTYAELAERQLEAAAGGPWHKFWLAPADHRAPDGGESFLDLIGRVAEAMRRTTEKFPGRDIVAVSHGGVIRAALAYALELVPDRALCISVENLSTTRMDHIAGPGIGGDWRVVFVNVRPRSS